MAVFECVQQTVVFKRIGFLKKIAEVAVNKMMYLLRINMRNRFLSVIPLFLSLSACVEPQQTSIVGPSGQNMLVAKCSQSPNACYQKASDTCSGSYQVLDSYSKAGGLLADVLPGPVTWYYMTYQCGQTDGQTPTFPFRGQQYTPPPVIQAPAPTTTTCNRYGNSVTCNSY
ncbi:hypothetical protein JQX09_11680 [Sulfitobacter pseudonitzschiae]|uniref:hypothetical protein n=1 Tax=Pseudosulfitobacter pseudonitzschiae TaxID=1402135 RepID=UPI001AF8D980|nr:hypothetical protein [Pseudosulfitobacter pseudonitzschiae]MBM2292578.1 hypothetical protein [Pseudosulfitobacter pseudonitzschiae]MBM2297495.1 hypothetical protein [Pseudosulfitobacter pseudonitzschiae]MBM2302409.1 hypothetical protein [Pseudosulfitobacter pseudonitzschiae]MBM2312192.1 hypothetical protein [Pseudosulfitobacter pseudonitzschiae]MBM2317105.1 hypothetical protein [Pseudosulfitobacter pseudonitzschiae]